MQVSTLDSRQKRFMWIHKEVDLTPQDQALGFESLDPFLSFFLVSKQGPCFTAIQKDGGDKRLVELELACKADGVTLPDPI